MPETRDLLLHSGSASDGSSLYHNLWRHESVFQYLFSKASLSEEAGMKRTVAYVQMHRDIKTEFFIYDKLSEQALGIAGIKQIQPDVFTVTDIAIGPAFTGRGYGTQVLNALIDLAFAQPGVHELQYCCFEQNTISRRLAESCGFVYSHSNKAELQKNGMDVILAHYRRRNL